MVVLAVSITVAVAVTAVAGVGVGIMAGVATAGALNNTINEVYYEHISDGESDLTSTSHTTQHVNRWDKLDYTKNQLKGTRSADRYDANAKRYHAEYSFHVVANFLSDALGIKGTIKESAEDAAVSTDRWDGRPEVDSFTLLFMILGF